MNGVNIKSHCLHLFHFSCGMGEVEGVLAAGRQGEEEKEEEEGVLGRQVMQDVTSHCDVSRRSPWKIPSARSTVK